jgi:hypothetical protein
MNANKTWPTVSFALGVAAAAFGLSAIPACSGQITLGNTDGGVSSSSSSSSGSSGGGPLDAGAPDCNSLPVITTPELVFTRQARLGEIEDFTGYGSKVYVALNETVNGFPAGRVLEASPGQSAVELVNVNPNSIARLTMLDNDRAALSLKENNAVVIAPLRTREAPTRLDSVSRAHVVFGESLFYFGPSRSGEKALIGYKGNSATTTAIVPDTYDPTDLITGGGKLFAVAGLSTDGPPRTILLAPPDPLTPTLSPSPVANVSGPALSLVATDGSAAFAVFLNEDTADLAKITLDGPGSRQYFATVGIGEKFGAIYVDDTYVYLERRQIPVCAGDTCTAPTAILRISKAGGQVDVVKQVDNPWRPDARRQFNADACYLYYLNGDSIYRQSKSALTPVR